MILDRQPGMKIFTLAAILAVNCITAAKTSKKTTAPTENPLPEPPKEQQLPKRCHQDFMISLGFEGHATPQAHKINMCNNIRYSCCTVGDQMNIFANWVLLNEEDTLKKTFKSHQEVYDKMLDLAQKANIRAKKTAERLKNRSTSNCKVLARRITHFRVEKVIPKLREAMVQMHEYFLKTYKGFYCTVCDAMMHKYIDVATKRFNFSHKMCRDIVSNSLHVLLYYHFHFAKYFNIVTRFVTICDVKGNFLRGVDVKVSKFSTSVKIFKSLEDCKKMRNDKTWFLACEPVCRNFQAVSFMDYFSPNLLGYHRYNRFLTSQINRLNKEEALIALLEQQDKKKKKSMRMLTEQAAYGTVTANKDSANEELEAIISDMMTFKQNAPAVRSAFEAGIGIETYESKFRPKGIDMNFAGEMSAISEAIYKSLKSEKDFKDQKAANGGKTPTNDESSTHILNILAVGIVFLLTK